MKMVIKNRRYVIIVYKNYSKQIIFVSPQDGDGDTSISSYKTSDE